MLFKLLSELSNHELRMVFIRAGIQGSFSESQAIVQLTIYLVKIGQDPFTYRFPVSSPNFVINLNVTEGKVVEDGKKAKDDASVVSELGSREAFILSAVPSNVQGGSGMEIKETEEVFKDVKDLEDEELVEVSPYCSVDGLSTSSRIISNCSSVLQGSSSDSWAIVSPVKYLDLYTSVSTEKIIRSVLLEEAGTHCSLKTLHLHHELWPPDY